MPRVKRGFKARHRRQRVLDRAEGCRGRRKNCYRLAAVAVDHALKNAYRGRKLRKRDFRSLWITRINAAARNLGVSYSRFMCGVKRAGIELDRRMLALLAVEDPAGFASIAQTAKSKLG